MVILYLIARAVQIYLGLVYACMFVRAILSWFMQEEGSFVMGILCMITEPVIAPIRMLLMRIPALQSFPLDISFLVAFLAVSMLQTFLPPLTLL